MESSEDYFYMLIDTSGKFINREYDAVTHIWDGYIAITKSDILIFYEKLKTKKDNAAFRIFKFQIAHT